MNYITLSALLLGALFLWLWGRYYLLKNNYAKYIEMSASLLLAKERSQRSYVNGSVIFQLQRHPETLEALRITSVRGSDEGTSIREFGSLYFELHADNKHQGHLCSVGIMLTDRALQCYGKNEGFVHIRGVLRFADNTEKSFMAKLPTHLISR